VLTDETRYVILKLQETDPHASQRGKPKNAASHSSGTGAFPAMTRRRR